MSPDNPTQILTTHDLSNLRSLQSVSTSVATSTPTTFVSNNHSHNNMVLSTIPLDGHALLIQRSQLSTAAIASNTQQQLRATTVSATNVNGLRATNANNASNNLSNLLAAAAKSQTILSTSNGNITNNSGSNMPTTSNYVFLQQNGNGQYTTYEGTTNNNSTNVGKIVLLATEPMDLNGSNNTEQQHVITTTGDNDEELRPLAWLNDSNLIKGIVTTSAAANAAGNNGAKRALGNNICIVSTNNAHDLIEELPTHVAGEEHVATTNSNNVAGNTDLGDTQIMSVSDYQQQFIASNKRFGNNQQFSTLANFALSEQDAAAIVATSTAGTKEQQQHVYSNIAAIGATTTVHVGPSGTTTVVEYKSNANYMPTQRQMLGNNNVASNATTITATNLTNSNNNYVPSTTTASNNNNIHVPASTPTPAKQISLPNTIVTTTSSNNNAVANGNSATNTIYQGQKQTNGNSNNSNSSAGSTTHHPHKKYLREKMNVMDHGGGGIATSSAAVTVSTITVVSSPASSNNSLSSSSSTSSSTAAVNGGNSPVSKSFYTLGGGSSGNGGSAAVAVNYSNSSNSSSSAAATFVAVSAASSSLTSSPSLTTVMPTYTIVSQHQQQQHVSSPAMSSPEPLNSKEYYTLTAPQHHQQQQQLQLQQQHLSMRSPTSYSSYENDSLKDFEMSTTNSSASGVRLTTSTPQHHSQQQQTTPKSSSSAHANSTTPQKQKHPNNVPYDPLVHTHNKPPYSFSSLIFMAIEGSNEKALPVKEIYAWIVQHFPYFKGAPTGWKNSVRHNLSLNKSFVKVEKAPNMGKGSLWRVEQQQRQNLIQALTRSPFFPNSAVDKIALKSPNGGSANSPAYDTVDGNSSSGGKGSSTHIDPRFDPRLFPNLSRAYKGLIDVAVADVPDDEIPSDYSTTNHNNSNNKKYNYSSSLQNGGSSGGSTIMGAFSNYESMERLARDCGADSIDDVNAAAAMLALKHGPKVFAETFQNGSPVITSSPSEDHTYSAGGGSTTGSGASTPLTNGNSGPQQQQQAAIIINGNGVAANGQQNGCDNQSNCASSDAAYESSEENHNITPEELEDQQRHRDGVDALLSLSLSSVIDSSTSCSPIKRPSSTSVEEEHISACISPTASHQHHHMGNKMALLTNAAAAYSHHQHPQAHHHSILDEGYNTQSYCVSNVSHHHLHHLASPSPQKKTKPLRNLRTKIKRKTSWLR